MAWNRPAEAYGGASRRGAVRDRGSWYGGIAAAVVVAGVVAAVFLLFPARRDVTPEARPKPKAIKAVSPAPAAKAEPAVPVVEPVTERVVAATSEVIRIGNREYDLAKLRAEDPAKYARVTSEYARVQAELEKIRREPVKGLAEQLLVMVSPLKKGDVVPPPPIGGLNPALEKEAEAMLEKVGKVEEWDDETSVGIKERLEALKDEWYAAKEAGQSFHDFLTKRLNAANFDTQTLDEARQFDAANYNDTAMSDAEYEKSHEKVNKLLELQGFEKIKRPDEEAKEADEEEPAQTPAEQQ